MNYLLDTHVMLWALFEPARIRASVRKLIEASENNVQVSALSFWEIAIKYQIGKLYLENCTPDDLPDQVKRMRLEILPLDAALLASSYRLPLDAHKDPFDRLLAWHAIHRGMILVTQDRAFEEYRSAGLKMLW